MIGSIIGALLAAGSAVYSAATEEERVSLADGLAVLVFAAAGWTLGWFMLVLVFLFYIEVKRGFEIFAWMDKTTIWEKKSNE